MSFLRRDWTTSADHGRLVPAFQRGDLFEVARRDPVSANGLVPDPSRPETRLHLPYSRVITPFASLPGASNPLNGRSRELIIFDDLVFLFPSKSCRSEPTVGTFVGIPCHGRSRGQIEFCTQIAEEPI
jgi:hypothetical protein